MQNQTQTNAIQQNTEAQGYFGNPQVFLTKRNSLVHVLGNELRIEMPVNLYKKILGIPFEKNEQEKSISQRATFGLIARPVIYIKGNYLVHRVLGIRVSKHTNYYKRIFQASLEATTEEALSA